MVDGKDVDQACRLVPYPNNALPSLLYRLGVRWNINRAVHRAIVRKTRGCGADIYAGRSVTTLRFPCVLWGYQTPSPRQAATLDEFVDHSLTDTDDCLRTLQRVEILLLWHSPCFIIPLHHTSSAVSSSRSSSTSVSSSS